LIADALRFSSEEAEEGTFQFWEKQKKK